VSELVTTLEPLAPAKIAEIEKYFESKLKITPAGAPILVLAGGNPFRFAWGKRHRCHCRGK